MSLINATAVVFSSVVAVTGARCRSWRAGQQSVPSACWLADATPQTFQCLLPDVQPDSCIDAMTRFLSEPATPECRPSVSEGPRAHWHQPSQPVEARRVIPQVACEAAAYPLPYVSGRYLLAENFYSDVFYQCFGI